jgi:hypothetical protein
MADEKVNPEAPVPPQAPEAGGKTVKVTLKVATSEADAGTAGTVGDVIELDAEQAERWIAAGLAEAGSSPPRPAAPTEPPSSGGPTGRRSASS